MDDLYDDDVYDSYLRHIHKKDKVVFMPSTRKNKKYMAIFNNDKVVHVGSTGYSDFTINKDENKKRNYIKRHQVNENFDDPYSPSALSRWILWNKPTLDESIRDYKIRFDFN